MDNLDLTPTPAGRDRRGTPSGLTRSVAGELARLTDRDKWLLGLLAEHRVLTTEQITRIAFDNPRRARRRLLTLHQRGVLHRFRGVPRPGSEQWRWTLGPVGAATVAAAAGIPAPRPAAVQATVDRLAASPRLAHLLAINDFFCRLISHARHHRETRLLRWWSERQATTATGGLVRPDGAGLWHHNGSRVAFWLEMDRGTEPLPRLVSKIIDGYQRLSGTPIGWPVLFMLPTSARETNLHTQLARTTTTAGQPVVAATATGGERGAHPAAAIWWPVGQPQARCRLADLPTSGVGT
ncbi:MAG: replication-relaxation family protein [Natronosporangium sp.]